MSLCEHEIDHHFIMEIKNLSTCISDETLSSSSLKSGASSPGKKNCFKGPANIPNIGPYGFIIDPTPIKISKVSLAISVSSWTVIVPQNK